VGSIEDNKIIVIRGGGDLATGVAAKFYRAGFRVLILEITKPTAIRRAVALSEAVYDGTATVENITCHRVSDMSEAEECWNNGVVPLIVEPDGTQGDGSPVQHNRTVPLCLIDAIVAKRNTGTSRDMADITIALGPGFTAGVDVDAVIETNRGNNLGRIILDGQAEPNTGKPGEIAGESIRRVVRAPIAGTVSHIKQIGDIVKQGESLLTITAAQVTQGDSSSAQHKRTVPLCSGVEVTAPISGLLRGLIRNGSHVTQNMKIADIDPRTDIDWRKISDKANRIGEATHKIFLTLSE